LIRRPLAEFTGTGPPYQDSRDDRLRLGFDAAG